jgi:hypothetical protein
VAAWPESANNLLLDADDPDESNTVYNAVRTRLVELQRDILRLCPACEPSAATLYGLNYPHRRAMLALLFCKIPVRDIRRLYGAEG